MAVAHPVSPASTVDEFFTAYDQAGNLYVVSQVFDRHIQIEVFNKDLCWLRLVELPQLYQKIGTTLDQPVGKTAFDYLHGFCCLPDGNFLFTTQYNRAYIYDPKLEQCLNTFSYITSPFNKDKMYASNFTRLVTVLPDSRLLCFISNGYTNLQGEIFAVSTVRSPSLLTPKQPELEVITKFIPSLPPIPYLVDHYQKHLRLHGNYYKPLVMQLLPLDAEHFLFMMIAGLRDKYAKYLFQRMNLAGDQLDTLELAPDETPYKHYHYKVAFDPVKRWIIYKTHQTLYFFDDQCNLLYRLSLDSSPALKQLKGFHILDCSSRGNLLLIRKAEKFLLQLDPFDDFHSLSGVIEEGIKTYRRAKKGAS
jgi:hypothetical protein